MSTQPGISRKKRSTREQKIAFLRAHPEILQQPFPNPKAQSKAVVNALLKAGLISPKTSPVDVQSQALIAEFRRTQ